MPVLITGGTGTLGRHLVARLIEAQSEVRVLSRSASGDRPERGVRWCIGDLRKGSGLSPALAGVDTVVHCASAQRGDVEAARNLIHAATRSGGPHVVYISIVGVDRMSLGYYRGKFEVERLLGSSGLPYTILRATQFHDLVRSACRALARPPIMLVPAGFSLQPIGADEVAQALAALANGAPSGRVPDMGGPQVLSASALARTYLAAQQVRRPVVVVRLAGRVATEFRGGHNLAADRAVGRLTFDEFMRARISVGDVSPDPEARQGR